MFKKSMSIFLSLLTLGVCSLCEQGFSMPGEAFERLVSEERGRARPGFMPPKPRWEDGRHFARPETEAFLELPLDEGDKVVIRQFIVNLSERSIEDLLADRQGLEDIKGKLDSIHPLRLAGFIFSDSTTRHHAKILANTEVKSNLFIILLQVEVQSAKENGILDQYLPGFVDFLGLDINVVRHYINQTDYRSLIRYMLQM